MLDYTFVRFIFVWIDFIISIFLMTTEGDLEKIPLFLEL